MHPVVHLMHRVAYIPTLLCPWNELTYMHNQNGRSVTMFAAAAVLLQRLTQCLAMYMHCCGRGPHCTYSLSVYIRCRTLSHLWLALQCSLRVRCIACRCIWFAIILFFMSDTYCLIFTLSSTMPSLHNILR